MDNQLDGPLKRKANASPVHRESSDFTRNLLQNGNVKDMKRMSDAPRASI